MGQSAQQIKHETSPRRLRQAQTCVAATSLRGMSGVTYGLSSGVRKRVVFRRVVVSRRVVLADVPLYQKPERGYIRMCPCTKNPGQGHIWMFLGHPQTCVYPDVCLGIAHVSGKARLPGQAVWQIHNVSAPFAPRNL